MRIDNVERHECTVNSSELAAHARAEQRSKHTCFTLTVRTPSVSTLFGVKDVTQKNLQRKKKPSALKNLQHKKKSLSIKNRTHPSSALKENC